MTICVGTWMRQYINRLNTEITLWQPEAGCNVDTIPVPKGVCLNNAIVDLWDKLKEVSERRYQQIYGGSPIYTPCDYATTYGCINDVVLAFNSINYICTEPNNINNDLYGCDPLIPDGFKFRITGIPEPWDDWNTDLSCMTWTFLYDWRGGYGLNLTCGYDPGPASAWGLLWEVNPWATILWVDGPANPCNPENVYELTPASGACENIGVMVGFCDAVMNNLKIEVRYFDSDFTT